MVPWSHRTGLEISSMSNYPFEFEFHEIRIDPEDLAKSHLVFPLRPAGTRPGSSSLIPRGATTDSRWWVSRTPFGDKVAPQWTHTREGEALLIPIYRYRIPPST